jgi:ABC-2 type transport system permease protein
VSSLHLSPAPAAASLPVLVGSHARMELRLLVRNGEQVGLTLVVPLLVLFGGAASAGVVSLGSGRRIDVLTPGVIALAIMSTSFTSLAIATGFERRYGVLKRLGATPLTRSGLLLGKVLALLAVEAAQTLVVALAAWALGWHPAGGVAGLAWCVLLGSCGTAAFASFALLLAGTVRAEGTLALANLLYVVLAGAGAVVLPVSSYPSGMRDVVLALPSGALAQGLRETLSGSGVDGVRLLVLLAWAVVGAAAASRWFAWE